MYAKIELTLPQLIALFFEEQDKAQRALVVSKLKASKLEERLLEIEEDKKKKLAAFEELEQQVEKAQENYRIQAAILQKEMDEQINKAQSKKEIENILKQAQKKLKAQNQTLKEIVLKIEEQERKLNTNLVGKILVEQEKVSKSLVKLLEEQMILIDGCIKRLQEHKEKVMACLTLSKENEGKQPQEPLTMLPQKVGEFMQLSEPRMKEEALSVRPLEESANALKQSLHIKKVNYLLEFEQFSKQLKAQEFRFEIDSRYEKMFNTFANNKAFSSPLKTIQSKGYWQVTNEVTNSPASKAKNQGLEKLGKKLEKYQEEGDNLARQLEEVKQRAGILKVESTTLLIAAVQLGEVEKVRSLLELEIDVNQKSPTMQTALHFASLEKTYNSVALIEMLLNRGANPEMVDGLQWTPIHYAIYTGNIAALEYYKSKKCLHADHIIFAKAQKKEEVLFSVISEKELTSIKKSNYVPILFAFNRTTANAQNNQNNNAKPTTNAIVLH